MRIIRNFSGVIAVIRNIIFDLGNVLLTWRPKEFLSQFTPNLQRIEQFVLRVPQNPTWYEIDRGTITLDQAKAIFLERHPEDKDLIDFYFSHWLEMFVPIEGTVDLVNQVKQRGFHAYLLSNLTEKAHEYISHKYDLFSLFDGMVFSFQENRIKPEPEIYKRLVERYALVPGECIYVDDLVPFVAVAKDLGMTGIVFTTPAELRMQLHGLSIL